MLDLSPKKNAKQLLIVVSCVGVMFTAVVWIANALIQQKDTGWRIQSPIRPESRRISHATTVKAGYLGFYDFTIDHAPARLHGDWSSSRPEGEDGATHDLVDFEILDTSDAMLYSRHAETHGKFDITLGRTGTYRFKLNNAGLLRSSSRYVRISATLDTP